MDEIVLGKISRVKIGFCGYQDVMLGIEFSLESDSAGCSDTWAVWSDIRNHADIEMRNQELSKIFLKIRSLLQVAKIKDVNDLVGIPIEMTFDNVKLKSWRILKEVL